jgi:transcriptional regulator with XRE-family HTH domain
VGRARICSGQACGRTSSPWKELWKSTNGRGSRRDRIGRIESSERHPSTKALRKLAPKLQVSVHWLETGQTDPAEQLARLVLKHQGRSLPVHATTLARAVLGQSLGRPG